MQNNKYFIDSNIFFYAKIGDRKYGECSKKVIRKIYEVEAEGHVDVLVLLEVANALSKFHMKREEITREITAIISLPINIVDVSKEDIVESSEIDLKPYDALHYYVSRKIDARIISADSDFDKFGRVDPCEIDKI